MARAKTKASAIVRAAQAQLRLRLKGTLLKAVSVERDQLRALRDDLDDLLESCEAAAAGIEDAIDALSRHA